MIIGITGWFASGKDLASEFLKDKGFGIISLSDIIREYLAKKKLEPTRDNLQKMGNELRKKFGPDFLAREALKRIKKDNRRENFAIPSIRLPAEAKTFHKNSNFQLWEIYAPVKIRYQRLIKRARTTDEKNLTFAEFKHKENLENGSDPSTQQVGKVIRMADLRIRNTGSIAGLKQKINKTLLKFAPKSQSNADKNIINSNIKNPNLTRSPRRKTKRLNVDDYFMKIALVVSERATCRRHSVGAIIVKDKVILATGYNGAPKGAKDCLELGCLRDKLGIPSGQRNEICRAAHAEQNAIIQSAGGLGSTNGATMYCTHSPCNVCAKMMTNAGISEVVVFEKYADQQFKKLFKELGIKVRRIKKPELSIDFYE